METNTKLDYLNLEEIRLLMEIKPDYNILMEV